MTSTAIWLPLLWYAIFNLSNSLFKFNIKTTTIVVSNIILLITALSTQSSVLWDYFTQQGFSTINFNNVNVFVSNLNLGLSYEFSLINFSFSFLVILIGCGANLYALNYFKNEADEKKLVNLLNLFILSMLTLVLSANFYTLFLGWELIGLTSFLLINFWSLKISVLKSAFKAFTFNLASDIFLLGSLTCFYLDSNTTSFSEFMLWVDNLSQNEHEVIFDYYSYYGIIFLCLCGSIKSVQIIMHIWLPDSMEAPVPASSLIHSATLVSAGIYLLCKFNILIEVYNISSYLSFIGAVTALAGGLASSQQTDLKKLLAYSTMSHCGFMWYLASNSYLYLTLFYLFLHGIFKATTFFCAGSFIRSNNTQDMRLMNTCSSSLPLDSILMLVCAGNLAGLPLSVGYLYKQTFSSVWLMTDSSVITHVLLIFGLLSSIIYFYKITKYTMFSINKSLTQNQNLLSRIKYKIDNKFSSASINHLVSVFIIFFIGFMWVFFFATILTTAIDFCELNSELIINVLQGNILLNSNIIILFYGIYFLLFIITTSPFWKTKNYANELISGWCLTLVVFLFV